MDFLTFKSFISTEVLIAFYYMGAVILPAAAWYSVIWLTRKYDFANAAYEKGKKSIGIALNKKQKITLSILFISCFLLMELFWRMFFEFLIAYMQIRDALLQAHV